jgi:hypothetical protein
MFPRAPRWMRSWPLLLLLYLVLLPVLFKPSLGVNDPAGYYAWARSLLIDGDLQLENEFARYGMDQLVPRTPTGNVHNQWAAGSSWIWLPALALAHTLVRLSAAWGLAFAADGYSPPYLWAAGLTTTLSGLGAVLLLYHLARQLFSPVAALWGVLGVWLATPLVFYQYHQPFLAHAHDALFNVLFVWLWWRAHRTGFQPVALVPVGVAIGAATWVRTQNGLWIAATLLEMGVAFLPASGVQPWIDRLKRALLQATGLLAGFALLFIPLAFFWRAMYGAWLVNTYTASGGGVFDWSAPHWWRVLLSSDRGLWVWAPITLVSLAGLRPLYRTDRRLAVLLSCQLLLQWYLISCWSYWSGGHAFGPRLWLALIPTFGLSLAAWIDQGEPRQWRPRWVTVGAVALLIAWNFLLILQYSLGLLAPTGEVDLALMVKNQFLVAPQSLMRVYTRVQQLLVTLSG